MGKMDSWIGHWERRVPTFKAECAQAQANYLERLDKPLRTQEHVLEDIISVCQKSLFWKENGFQVSHCNGRITRTNIPVMTYEGFREILVREGQQKGGILSCSPVVRWLKTSGTTGQSKRIPYTLHWIRQYRVPAIQAMWGFFGHDYPALHANPWATLDTQTVRDPSNEYVEGLPYQAISNRHPQIGSGDWNPPWYEAPWFTPTQDASHEQKMYARLLWTLGEDVRLLTAINPSTLLSLHHSLLENRERLLRDLHDGAHTGNLLRAADPAAARRLEAVLAADGVSLTDVWPGLERFSCWTAASAKLYKPQLERIMGQAKVLPFMSCGTEGVVTLPVDADQDSQPLAVDQAFFEFIPVSVDMDALVRDQVQPETVALDQLKEGDEYHLVMWQGNGMVRMYTGDIYRVHGYYRGVPRISFSRRNGVMHSFTGEKITETQLHEAVQMCGIPNAGLYLCAPVWHETPYYAVAIEASGTSCAESQTLSQLLDGHLQAINIEYESKRSSKRLGQIKVITVPCNAISMAIEREKAARKTLQIKYKPFQPDLSLLGIQHF
ncbi:GH3 auxin-responsive promoter family protein [Pseudomonas sp. PAMC 26793]|uniref:GH3 family domain-containing protein n=1 Tax=Pseudomonas sp. PAMC 26793 TaxID=1240676 RepID=UPI000363C338